MKDPQHEYAITHQETQETVIVNKALSPESWQAIHDLFLHLTDKKKDS